MLANIGSLVADTETGSLHTKAGLPLRIQMAGGTDTGLVRKSNQDSYYFDPSLGIAVVADGIGGRKGGDIASGLAVEGVRDAFLTSEQIRHDQINPFLLNIVETVNRSIRTESKRKFGSPTMGTTLNMVWVVGNKAYITHVGDSRTYLYFEEQLWQLTVDHSVEEFVKRGFLPKAAYGHAKKKTALVRSMGLSEHVDADVYEIMLRPGEILLTCSDGVTNAISDRKILSIIRNNFDKVERLPAKLIEAANDGGGPDNITAVVTKVVD